MQTPLLKGLRFDESRLLVELPNGYRILVFPNEYVGRSIYYFGDIDPKVTLSLARLLHPGDTLIDIGANVGVVTLLSLPLVGPLGRVVAVEPQPPCCETLRQTLALNNLRNVEVHPVALSREDGRMGMHLGDPENLGTAQLGPGSAGVPGVTEVEVRRGTSFLESLQLTGDYVVKIDVEGHEGDVMLGCEAYWERHPPKGIVFESTNHLTIKTDFFASAAYAVLMNLGFRLFQIHKTLFTLKYSEIHEWARRRRPPISWRCGRTWSRRLCTKERPIER